MQLQHCPWRILFAKKLLLCLLLPYCFTKVPSKSLVRFGQVRLGQLRLIKSLHTCKCSVAPGESCLQKSFFYVFFCHIVVPRFHQKVQFACLLPYLCSCAHTTNSQTFFQQFSFLEQKLPPPFNMLVIKYALYYHASLEKSDYTRN